MAKRESSLQLENYNFFFESLTAKNLARVFYGTVLMMIKKICLIFFTLVLELGN